MAFRYPKRQATGSHRWITTERGFAMVPVNPGFAGVSIHCQAVAAPLTLVDILRASDSVAAVVAEAVRRGAGTIWMRLGVVNQAAVAEARRARLTVAMDRCPVIEFARRQLS